MSFAEVIGRLAEPEGPAIVVSRRSLVTAGIAFLLLAVWAAGTAGYFLFHDDVAAHLIARQKAMQQAYEEKIGALRAHLDRVASQNVIDQDGLDRRLSELIARQTQIETRQAFLGNFSDRSLAGMGPGGVQQTGALPAASAPMASAAAEQARERRKPAPLIESFGLRLRDHQPDLANGTSQRTSEYARPRACLRERIAHLQRALTAVESTQMQSLDHLLRTAEMRASRVREAIREAGLNPDALDRPVSKSGIGGPVGGPLVPIAPGVEAGPFEAAAERLQGSVERLSHLDRAAGALPFRRPLPGHADLTSAFGYRIDPFTRGPAMHTGIDFRAEPGAPVRATGAGQVVSAEYAGGYGNMVEIDHGNGVATRYAHLSSIAVSPGQTIAAGAVIGRAGSTGRSTGAHLHYETRVDGEAVDPKRFLRAGSRLATLGRT
jgi:murein DD-endopeptidase MepM/ murein hydrolase activator NlpD